MSIPPLAERPGRRDFLRAAAGSLAGAGAAAAGFAVRGDAASRPNFLFLLTDDQRWDALGCAGNPIVRTPVLDGLARDGTRFVNAFATTPICAASRASVLTGLYERTHGYTFTKPPLPRRLTNATYPSLLRQAGYRTGFVGKLGVSVEKGAEREMFDVFEPSSLPYFKADAGNPGGSHYLTDIQADRAVDFLRGVTPGQPFCLSVSFWAPHADDDKPEQYFWPAQLDDLYRDVRISPPPTSEPSFFESLPPFLQKTLNRVRWYWRFDNPEKYQRMVKGYYRMITALDAAAGRILEELRRRGLDRNTVVIFCSDNGYFLGDRGYAGKWTMHEPSIRVPFIVKDPRVPSGRRGRVLTEMVLNIDLAPTMLSLAGVPVPGAMQGRALGELVAGRHEAWRREIFTEHLWDNPEIPLTEAVRTERWKYIRYPQHPEFEELYDLSGDPREARNLAGDPAHRDRAFGLRHLCDAWVRRLSR